MKKKLILLLSILMVMSCLFSACGKSEEVKNVENLINSLNKSSAYREINAVYNKYASLDFKEREKVDNSDVLEKYCSTSNGHFTLTDNMLAEIKSEFSEPSSVPNVWKTKLDLSLSYKMTAKISANKITGGDWESYKQIQVSSKRQEDDYNYVVYGTVVIVDKYGKEIERNFEFTYFSEYDAEKDTYKIETELNIHAR